jgi:cytochrome P450
VFVSPPAPPNLLAPEHIDDPWQGLAVLRDHHPVYWDELIGGWVISRYADVRPLLTGLGPGEAHQELLGQYLGTVTSFTAMDGVDHRRRRALLAPYFARGGVERLHEEIERQARALLEPLFARERDAVASGARERGEVEFISEFTKRFSVNVIVGVLALPDCDYERINAWQHAWTLAEGNISRDPEIYERAIWARDDFGAYILPIIEERRESEEDDLISLMCRAEIEGAPVAAEEIRSIAAAMILAGGDTTGHQLSALVHALVQHPEQQRALVEDRGLMDRALAEGMRYCSIVQYLGRHTTDDLEIEGVKIGAGSELALLLASGNHDPRRWEQPDEFNIHRTDVDPAKAFTGAAEHLAFGAGAHFCPGSHLAKAEMEIALNVFFDEAGEVTLADGPEPRPLPDSPFIRTLPSLKLSFAAH